MRTAYVKKKGIQLRFDFDSWETTSVSSRGNLAGNWPCTGICIVRSVKPEGKLTVIRATGLAVGTGYSLPERHVPFGGIPFDPEEEEPNEPW